MTTKQSTRPTSGQLAPDYMLPDPPKTPDMQQNEQLIHTFSALTAHFADRPDVLVAGQGYLRDDPTNDAERFAPDCVVAFGVDAEAIVRRNGYVISDAGKPPDFVLEVASKSTGTRDYTVKRGGYARYGIQEYWRFDESGGRFHDAPLAGDTLVNGEYAPITINRGADGLLWGRSEVLDLDICWDAGRLRFFDPSTERYLPDAVELKEERDELEVERDAERAGRLAEEAGRLSAETEVRQLRERLRHYQE